MASRANNSETEEFFFSSNSRARVVSQINGHKTEEQRKKNIKDIPFEIPKI